MPLFSNGVAIEHRLKLVGAGAIEDLGPRQHRVGRMYQYIYSPATTDLITFAEGE